VGAQFLEQYGEEFVIRSVGLAEGIEDLESIVVKTMDGQPIHLRDVSKIEIGGAIRRGLQTHNGVEEVVAGMVMQLYGANTSQVIENVEEKLKQIRQVLPEGIRIVHYYEQKSLVEASVGTVTDTLIERVVLVVLVLLGFMGGLRGSLVVALALPFSALFAVIAMGQFGISANLMSLGGLAIAIGIMVDGAVVMVENVDRHLREANPDESRIHVVSRACREVGPAIVFAISIIIIVFLPLFTLQGVASKTFRPLAYTVALAMGGSLIYALLQAPVFSDLLMRGPKSKQTHRPRLWSRTLNFIPGIHGRNPHQTSSSGESPTGGHNEPWILRTLLVPYRPLVRFFVRHRWAAVALAVSLLSIGGAIFPLLGSEFTPRLNEGELIVNMTRRPRSRCRRPSA
jgi:cobalt-zinc-cadmium resistance protein CzcA